jgi:oligopeptide transport system ATP-binding protein
LVLYLGKVMEIAERDDFYARPLHPYSEALISAVPIADPRIERSRERVILQGDIPSPISPPSGCRFRTRCPHAEPVCAEREPPLTAVGSDRWASCHMVQPGSGHSRAGTLAIAA